MDKKRLSGSTLWIIITILITIFPVTQIILLTLNGGFTYIFSIPFESTTESEVTEIASIVVNSILIILGFITFYFSRKTWMTITSTFLIMFSGQMLMLFVSDEFNGGDNYLLGWLTVSGIPAITILILGMIKHYKERIVQNSIK